MVDKFINDWMSMLDCGKHCTECEYFNSISLECEKPETIDVDETW